jgi:hypothetical protein
LQYARTFRQKPQFFGIGYEIGLGVEAESGQIPMIA